MKTFDLGCLRPLALSWIPREKGARLLSVEDGGVSYIIYQEMGDGSLVEWASKQDKEEAIKRMHELRTERPMTRFQLHIRTVKVEETAILFNRPTDLPQAPTHETIPTPPG